MPVTFRNFAVFAKNNTSLNPTSNRPAWLYTALILAIMVVAVVLRFRYLTEIEHNVDHAYTVWQAMTTLDRGEFPLAGQGTSVLFANPPLTGYLYIPAVALTRSPLGVYVFVIALNALAVWFTYRAGRALISPEVGLIASWLVAVNPWIIEYSRTSWVQSLLPFFVSLVFWLIVPVLNGTAQRPIRRTALALIAGAFLANTYLLAYFVIAPLLVLGVIYRKRIPVRGVVLGGSIFALMGILYAIGLVQQWDTVQNRLDSFSTGESRITLDAWEAALRLVTGAEYELARGLEAPVQDWATRHDLSTLAHYGLLAFTIAGIGLALWQFLAPRLNITAFTDTKLRESALILGIWFFLPIVAMSYTSNPVHTFYQLMGIPAGAIFAGWGIMTLLRADTRLGAGVIIAGLLLFGALMSINSARYYQGTEAIPGAHQLYALPLDVGLEIGAQVDALLPENGLVYAEAEEWIINSFTGRLFTVSADTRAPLFNYVPVNGAVYVDIVTGDGASNALPAGNSDTAILDLPDSQVIITGITPASAYEIAGEAVNVPSQQGITLIAWSLTQRDASADYVLETTWRVDSVSEDVPNRLFAPFAHLFNTEGERFRIVDGQPVPGPLWQIGDIHVHQMPFTAEQMPFRLVVGQFDGSNHANVIFFPLDAEPSVIVELVSIED